MNPLSLNPVALITGLLLSLLLGFGAGWKVQAWRHGEQMAKIERDQAAAAETASESARLKERSWNQQLTEARNEATKRETKIRADGDTARRSADGLRNEITTIRRQLPELASDAARQRADAIGGLLADCAEVYRGVAESADRLAKDRQTLMQSWPK